MLVYYVENDALFSGTPFGPFNNILFYMCRVEKFTFIPISVSVD